MNIKCICQCLICNWRFNKKKLFGEDKIFFLEVLVFAYICVVVFGNIPVMGIMDFILMLTCGVED